MNNIFYVYIYLDPRKNGGFKYGNYRFEYEPFYVGKGHGRRDRDHLAEAYYNQDVKKGKRDRKCSIIRKIKRVLGKEPLIERIAENLSEDSSFELEKNTIESIGRADLKKGPLVNLTDGGEGLSGYIATAEHRKKNSESLKGRIISEETRKKMSAARIGKKLTSETRRKMSESRKGEKNPMWEKKRPDITGEKNPSKRSEVKKKLRKANQGTNNPMFGVRGKDHPRYGIPVSDEVREKIRKKLLESKHIEGGVNGRR